MPLEPIGMQNCCISQYILHRRHTYIRFPLIACVAVSLPKQEIIEAFGGKIQINFRSPCQLPREERNSSPARTYRNLRGQPGLRQWRFDAARRSGQTAPRPDRARRSLPEEMRAPPADPAMPFASGCVDGASWYVLSVLCVEQSYFFFGKTVSFIPLPTRNLRVVLAGI